MTAAAVLTLPQRLALVKYITERLAAVRKDDLVPQAGSEMPSGSRLPVFFAGRQAGWASMPQPSRKAAYVSDPAKLLAWARAQYPAKVITDRTVRVTDEVLAVLAEHLPGAIVETPLPDPQWVADLLGALKGGGSYLTHEGEKLTEVPGITVPESDPPAPRVELADAAGEIIGAAWRDGAIPLGDLLALPAPNGDGPP